MAFEIGQIFEGEYPPEAAFWCNDCGDRYIKEIEPQNGVLRFQIVAVPEPTDDELASQVRAERDMKIAETDYLAMPDYPLSDEDKAKKDVDEKDKEIAALKSQIARRQTLDDTDKVLRENGLTVPSNVLNFLVSDDADNTYSNVKAFIDYTETVKDSVREEFKKGRTPRVSGTTAKAVSQQDFDMMTQKERVALFHTDPELFRKLTTGGR